MFWTAISDRAIVDQNERRTRHAKQPARHDLSRRCFPVSIRIWCSGRRVRSPPYRNERVARPELRLQWLGNDTVQDARGDQQCGLDLMSRVYDHAKGCESEYFRFNISGSSSTATATCTSCSSAPTWWRKPTRSSPTTTERCFQTAEGPPPDFLSSAPCYQERRQATYLADLQHLTPKKPLLSAPVLRERVRPLAATDRRSGIGKAGPRGLPGGHLVLGGLGDFPAIRRY